MEIQLTFYHDDKKSARKYNDYILVMVSLNRLIIFHLHKQPLQLLLPREQLQSPQAESRKLIVKEWTAAFVAE